MDPNTTSQLTGLIYVQRFQSETAFSVYDRLTPDKPSWRWQAVKRVVVSLIHRLTARQHSSRPSSFPIEAVRETVQ
jgi:hypothetical protein